MNQRRYLNWLQMQREQLESDSPANFRVNDDANNAFGRRLFGHPLWQQYRRMPLIDARNEIAFLIWLKYMQMASVWWAERRYQLLRSSLEGRMTPEAWSYSPYFDQEPSEPTHYKPSQKQQATPDVSTPRTSTPSAKGKSNGHVRQAEPPTETKPPKPKTASKSVLYALFEALPQDEAHYTVKGTPRMTEVNKRLTDQGYAAVDASEVEKNFKVWRDRQDKNHT